MAKGSFFKEPKKNFGKPQDRPLFKDVARKPMVNKRGFFEGSDDEPRRAPKSGKRKAAATRRKGSDDDDEEITSDDYMSDDDLADEAGAISDTDVRNKDHQDSEDENQHLRTKESAAAKRLRLSKQYLASLKDSLKPAASEDTTATAVSGSTKTARGSSHEFTGEFFAEDLDRDLIASRLIQDTQEQTGRVQRAVAPTVQWPLDPAAVRTLSGHRLTVTAVVVLPNGKVAYSGSKDGTILRYDLTTGRRTVVAKGAKLTDPIDAGHRGDVLCLAVSFDGRFLASGGVDHKIRVWSTETHTCQRVFHQHKEAVTGLSFQRSTAADNQLYSCARDRMVKVWDVSQLSYVDTLFGHQEAITDIASLSDGRVVTTGSRDRTLRLWKVNEEKQFVFRGGAHFEPGVSKSKSHTAGVVEPRVTPIDRVTDADVARGRLPLPYPVSARRITQTLHSSEGSLDVVAMINESLFVTGGDSGAIALWDVNKKKPVYIHHIAHGAEGDHEGLTSASYPAPANNDAESDDGEPTDATREVPATQWAQPRTAFRPDLVTHFGGNQALFPDLRNPRWITALTVLPYGDLFASGSWDGYIRVWQLAANHRSFKLVTTIPVVGFVNSLQFVEPPMGPSTADNDNGTWVDQTPLALLAAVGQEHKAGRWLRIKEARNCVKVIPFNISTKSQMERVQKEERLKIFQQK